MLVKRFVTTFAACCSVFRQELWRHYLIMSNIKFMEVKDSNGNLLAEGDAVTVIKDLKVRGSSAVIKRGTKVKNIRLTDDEEEIEGKIDGSVIVLKTCFLKKA
ncbi:MAG: hypothetical protein DYG98_11400 [Haliscomenobacteraceae bacterium CHB4]|nr:hypothetical protein [Haliscomenobacteraceae bacterium CHB4]